MRQSKIYELYSPQPGDLPTDAELAAAAAALDDGLLVLASTLNELSQRLTKPGLNRHGTPTRRNE